MRAPGTSILKREFLRPTDPFQKWVKQRAAPNIYPDLIQNTLLDLKGPWVALDGYVEQQDRKADRRVSIIVRALLVPRGSAKDAVTLLAKSDSDVRSQTDPESSPYMFAGEAPWCRTFRETESLRLTLVVRERKVKRQRQVPVVLLRGKPVEGKLTAEATKKIYNKLIGVVEDTTPDADNDLKVTYRVEEVEEVERDVKTIPAFPCVVSFNPISHTRSTDDVRGVILARAIAHSANLVGIPQSLDLQNEEGERVTIGVSYGDRFDRNEEAFFYVRNDVLRNYLRSERMELVWVVWGERSRSYGGGMGGIVRKDMSYVGFQSVRQL